MSTFASPGEYPIGDEADKAKKSKESHALRIDSEIFGEAKAAAAMAHRTTPKQLEYWAKVGQLLCEQVPESDIFSLLSGQKYIANVLIKENQDVAVDEILGQLEHDRLAGTLSGSVSKAAIKYDMPAKSDGLIRQVDENGNESFGSFENGHFIEKGSGL